MNDGCIDNAIHSVPGLKLWKSIVEKLGYRVVGEMADYPPGESFYWLRKDF